MDLDRNAIATTLDLSIVFHYRNMIAMFDKCARNQQTDNLEQIACTEIRKANLANCNYMVYAMRGFTEETSPFKYNNQVTSS